MKQLDSSSSILHDPLEHGEAHPQESTVLQGGEDEPITAIDDPELRAEFMRAHRAWALRYQPHLLEPWLE